MIENARDSFPFLDLPPELRNKIYTYLLATEYVTKHNINPNHWEPGTILGSIGWPQVGDVRCPRVWIESSTYTLSILCVSRQVYQESSTIFSANSWILVRVNRSGFAHDLKRRGFNVFPINISKGINISMLIVSIHFPSLASLSESDTFVINSAAVGRLQTALFSVLGLEEMRLSFVARQDFPRESNSITAAFSQLRSIGSASVCGPGSGYSLGSMTREISSPFTSSSAVLEFIQQRLQQCLSSAQKHQDNQNWHEAMDECLLAIVYQRDCIRQYWEFFDQEWSNTLYGVTWKAIQAVFSNVHGKELWFYEYLW